MPAPSDSVTAPKPGLFVLALAYLLLGAVLSLSYLLQFLGLTLLGFFGTILGNLLLALGFRKKIVTSNLELALGKELSASELRSLRKKVFRNAGITFLEIARNFSLSSKKMARELILTDADAATIRAVLARGKGAVFISGHLGNWELLGMGMASKGFPVAIVVKKMNNPFAQVLIERQRKKTGIEIIYSGNTLEKMKATLKRGVPIGFMVDQNITGTRGIRANFFGVPAASIRGLAGLVKETGTPVIPFCAVRLPDGTNKLRLLPELGYLEATALPAGSPERAAREEWLNTQQYQQSIETLVRENLDQWLWIHRRWKTSREPLVFETAHLENYK